jgi:SPP1 family predicted phage head-tail adaptor
MPRFPRIGRLRQRVTIQSRADSESGLYSGISTRTTKITVWAKVDNVAGTQQIDSRNAGTGVSHIITIRYRTDISKEDEILYTDRIGTYRYAIQTIQNAGDERNQYLVLECNQMAESSTLDNPSPEAV